LGIALLQIAADEGGILFLGHWSCLAYREKIELRSVRGRSRRELNTVTCSIAESALAIIAGREADGAYVGKLGEQRLDRAR
jgi:hypothetical protein